MKILWLYLALVLMAAGCTVDHADQHVTKNSEYIGIEVTCWSEAGDTTILDFYEAKDFEGLGVELNDDGLWIYSSNGIHKFGHAVYKGNCRGRKVKRLR